MTQTVKGQAAEYRRIAAQYRADAEGGGPLRAAVLLAEARKYEALAQHLDPQGDPEKETTDE